MNCPECACGIELQSPEVGEITTCQDCGLELEVRSTDPLRVEQAPPTEEDWGE